ncbi:MAG: pyrroloquinoline quinone-dependent dehydrogenase [Bryobacterales bacterium]|nr:pyrroloquinoline quinone-dependent dehydrogenase [Bryobacterales bacterium]
MQANRVQTKRRGTWIAVTVIAASSGGCTSTKPASRSGPAAEWRHYGNDLGGARYSPLTEITKENVGQLKISWEYHHGDISTGAGGTRKSGFEATPILVDGTLYFPTPFNRIIALDPETGREKWTFDPHIRRTGDYGDGFVSRGVATWSDGTERRIYEATQDARLIAVNAVNGQRCADFGVNGEVRLDAEIETKRPGEYHMTSPPVVVRDTVIVGSAINDNARVRMPGGVVRGYDARTGARRWSWDPIAGLNAGAANAWGPLSGDEERDLVFVPTGSASPDFYGGERPGDNKWANSTVALRASTGEFVWGFQVVHHDVWDYDLAAQPTLFLWRGMEPAVVQATKMGHLFVLNRETGKPLLPVEERPVPQDGVPGERLSPTQPFPVATPALVPQRATQDDAWGLTPFDRKGCQERLAALRNDGIFTPPSIKGSLALPGNAGGTNWGGVSVDPVLGIIVVNQSNLPFILRLVPREKLKDDLAADPKPELGRQEGAPYAMRRQQFLSAIGMPCVSPPWGTLAGVDAATGRIRWQAPLGTIRDLSPIPVPWKAGTPNIGGPITTAGGVTFIAAALDFYLRAFDTATGTELWKARLPSTAQATPMTYRAREGGRQFVVIASGGHAKLDARLSDALIAFALE